MQSEVAYLCDVAKHEECKRIMCQKECFCTCHREYAKEDIFGEPIIVYKKFGAIDKQYMPYDNDGGKVSDNHAS